jgi:hypothetical protein
MIRLGAGRPTGRRIAVTAAMLAHADPSWAVGGGELHGPIPADARGISRHFIVAAEALGGARNQPPDL